jgi:hypothetical protein
MPVTFDELLRAIEHVPARGRRPSKRLLPIEMIVSFYCHASIGKAHRIIRYHGKRIPPGVFVTHHRTRGRWVDVGDIHRVVAVVAAGVEGVELDAVADVWLNACAGHAVERVEEGHLE